MDKAQRSEPFWWKENEEETSGPPKNPVVNQCTEGNLIQKKSKKLGIHLVSLVDFPQEHLMLRRVSACVGYGINGICFIYASGEREGVVLTLSGAALRPYDHVMQSRGGMGWDLIEHGDYITRVFGHNMHLPLRFLCHTLCLEFASGKIITYAFHHDAWKGVAFEHCVPPNCLVFMINFCLGRCTGITGIETTLHLPLSPLRMPLFPYKHKVLFLIKVAQQVDNDRSNRGAKPLGSDIWWCILGMLSGLDLPEVDSYQFCNASMWF
jgi:hypothetical protein